MLPFNGKCCRGSLIFHSAHSVLPMDKNPECYFHGHVACCGHDCHCIKSSKSDMQQQNDRGNGKLSREKGTGAAQHDSLFNFCVLPVLIGGLQLSKLFSVGCQSGLHLCLHHLFNFDWDLHDELLCRQAGCYFYSHCSCCGHHSRRPGGTGKSKDHVCCS